VVGGRRHVRDIRLAQEREHRFQQAAHGVYRPAIWPVLLGSRVVGPEELEGGVNQVQAHHLRMLGRRSDR
jgi:hypothetical protein